MRIKFILIVLVSFLLFLSISQTLSIPPYEDDIFFVYKSGYFSELDRGFEIIKDSFLGIKTMKSPAYAWIFLSDIEPPTYSYTNKQSKKSTFYQFINFYPEKFGKPFGGRSSIIVTGP